MSVSIEEINAERERLEFVLDEMDLYMAIEIRLADHHLDVVAPVDNVIRHARPIARIAIYRRGLDLGVIRRPGSGLGLATDLVWEHREVPYSGLLRWLRALYEVLPMRAPAQFWDAMIFDKMNRTVEGGLVEIEAPKGGQNGGRS